MTTAPTVFLRVDRAQLLVALVRALVVVVFFAPPIKIGPSSGLRSPVCSGLVRVVTVAYQSGQKQRKAAFFWSLWRTVGFAVGG